MENNRLVVFLGAGVSRYVDKDMPGRSELLLELAKFARLSPEEEQALKTALATQNGFRQYMAADFIARRLGKDKLFQCCQGLLKANREKDETLRILRPLHDMKFRFAITTNYDTLIERSAGLAAKEGRPPLRKYTLQDLEAVLNSMREGKERFLFKIHGDLSWEASRNKNIVISLDSYYESIADARYLALMHAIFLNYTVLFLGYSLDDYDFNYIFSAVALLMRNSRQLHYALLPSSETEPVTREVLHAYGIEILSGDLKAFFEAVTGLGRASSPGKEPVQI
jgi:hypothetical protein